MQAHGSLHFRTAAALEGISLATLMLIAVPAKHMLGLNELGAIIGPIHGVCFLFFLWALLDEWTVNTRGVSWLFKMLGASMVPFGALFFLRRDARREHLPAV